MTLEQLQLLVQEAAHQLVGRTERPHPVTVVLPLAGSTRVLSLETFPDDDTDRHELLSRFAAEKMVPVNASCFGLLAEAEAAEGGDLLLVVYGARRRGSFVTAAPLAEDGTLGEFVPAEPLEPTALPFVRPLQHAADLAEADRDDAGGGLPITG